MTAEGDGHKASPEQWIGLEAARSGCLASCLLELRDRVKELEDSSYEHSNSNLFCFDALVSHVEVLEKSNQALHTTTLKLANAIVGSPEKRRSLLTDLIADEDDSKPTPNSDQIGSSLKAQDELSLSAQAVLKAAQDSYWCFDAMALANAEVIAAAVLRAAADQLALKPDERSKPSEGFARGLCTGVAYTVNELRLMADELRSING